MIEDEGTGLGDVVSKALTTIGVTEERVSEFLGKPCGCGGRREKLNQLGAWAKRVAAGKVEGARGYLDRIFSDW